MHSTMIIIVAGENESPFLLVPRETPADFKQQQISVKRLLLVLQ